jgi:hypothetical protein
MQRPKLVSIDPLAPPYPPETKSRGWALDIDMSQVRLLDDWILSPESVRPWLLMLWLASWESVPCGSLPQNDAVIAARIGMEPAIFKAHRDFLLAGWRPHSDGNLYHEFTTGLVLKMMSRREASTKRQADFRASRNVTRDKPLLTSSNSDVRAYSDSDSDSDSF